MGLDNQLRLAANLEALETNGGTLAEAMIDAGYSPATASNGLAGIPDRVFELLGEKGSKIAKLGKKLSVDDTRNLALGRLAQNCAEGSDKGALSAKILGSRRELNLWTPDTATGLIVLQMPQSLTPEKLSEALKAPEE